MRNIILTLLCCVLSFSCYSENLRFQNISMGDTEVDFLKKLSENGWSYIKQDEEGFYNYHNAHSFLSVGPEEGLICMLWLISKNKQDKTTAIQTANSVVSEFEATYNVKAIENTDSIFSKTVNVFKKETKIGKIIVEVVAFDNDKYSYTIVYKDAKNFEALSYVEKGDSCDQSKDYEQAIKYYELASKISGHDFGLKIALSYYNKGNQSKYFSTIKKMADRKDAVAQYLTAYNYFNGIGVSRNLDEANKYVVAAMKNGYNNEDSVKLRHAIDDAQMARTEAKIRSYEASDKWSRTRTLTPEQRRALINLGGALGGMAR